MWLDCTGKDGVAMDQTCCGLCSLGYILSRSASVCVWGEILKTVSF